MSLAQALIQYASSGDADPSGILRALAASRRARMSEPRAPGRHQEPVEVDRPGPEGGYPTERAAGALVLPTSWRGTHDTSGADWNANAATAADIMAAAGTIVGAPEPGRIIRHGSAQGGESLYFDPDAPGGNYWIGHIANPLPIGTRVRRRGQRIAVVSPDHAAPHVHIDRIRGG